MTEPVATVDPLVDQVRRHLVELTELRGLNKRTLGALSGVGATTVQRILVGEGAPRVDIVDSLFRSLGFEPILELRPL